MTQKRLLAVAYHFPPIQGSSGVHRTLSLARYLPAHGWDVSVLTVSPRAYRDHRPENLALVPPETRVIRAPAFDTPRHLAIRGRYLGALALPDPWQSWIPGGIVAGLLEIRRSRPTALLSTFPIASAHVIARGLKKLTGLPWIADFRDPMYQEDYPPDPRVRNLFRRLEQRIFAEADRVTVTTRGTARYYRERYGRAAGARISIVPNGYDPQAFDGIRAAPPADGRRTLLHSGILYPSERDPSAFFAALAMLAREQPALLDRFRFVFRGSAHDHLYRDRVAQLGLNELVRFEPSLPYREALAEMLGADALLVFQASNCNDQVPAKIYEYLYARRPILAFTDPAGDTAQVLTGAGVARLAPLNDAPAIAAVLRDALPRLADGALAAPSTADLTSLSREARVAEVAVLLDELSSHGRSCLDNA